MANIRRQFRVGEQARAAMAMAVLQLSDPRLNLVTITAVKMTSDLRLAKVYWSVSGDDERKEAVDDAFTSARGVLRKELGRQLGLRFVPNVQFYYDETLDVLDETRALMKKVEEIDQKNREES